MRSGMSERPITSLLTDALGQVSTLVQAEIGLAKAELAERASKAAAGVGLMAGAMVVAIGAYIMFLFTIVRFMVLAGVPEHWATLIVTLLTALAAYVMVKIGAERLKPENLTPTRTIRNVKRDAQVVSEQV